MTLRIVYDGTCGFCRRVLEFFSRGDGGRRVAFFPSQDRAGLESRVPEALGADLDAAMLAVLPDGRVREGFFAFRELLAVLPRGIPFAALLHLPGAGWLGPRVYAWVARNRGRLGCGSTSCALPRKAGA